MDDGSGTRNGTRSGVTEPAHRGDEVTALLDFLRRQRELVVWKVSGAPDEVHGMIFDRTEEDPDGELHVPEDVSMDQLVAE